MSRFLTDMHCNPSVISNECPERIPTQMTGQPSIVSRAFSWCCQHHRLALSNLHQLALPQVFADPEGLAAPSTSAPVSLLTDKVFPCLLAACEDYTTDNRGDVGSWVRDAAMSELTSLVLFLTKYHQQQQNSQQGQGEAGRAPAAHGPLDAASLAQLAARVGGVLCKQGVERIVRVRQSAGRHLRALLACAPLAALLPDAAALRAALPPEDFDAAPVEGVTRMAAVLALRPYQARASLAAWMHIIHCHAPEARTIRLYVWVIVSAAYHRRSVHQQGARCHLEPCLSPLIPLLTSRPNRRLQAAVLEGLVASVGCVDASLSRVASSALVEEANRHNGAFLPQVSRVDIAVLDLHDLATQAVIQPESSLPECCTPLPDLHALLLTEAHSAFAGCAFVCGVLAALRPLAAHGDAPHQGSLTAAVQNGDRVRACAAGGRQRRCSRSGGRPVICSRGSGPGARRDQQMWRRGAPAGERSCLVHPSRPHWCPSA